MSVEENKLIVKRINQEGFNGRHTGVFDDLVAPDFTSMTRFGAATGPDALKATVRALTSAFPDARWQLLEVVAEHDRVWAWVRASGRHTGGAFLGIEPSGQRWEADSVHMFRLRDGQLIEHRTVRDDATMLVQLGAVEARQAPMVASVASQVGSAQ